MSTFRLPNHSSLIGLAAAIVLTAILSIAPAWAGDCCASRKSGNGHAHGVQSAGHGHAEHQQRQSRPASIVTQPPHGGQVYATNLQYFEVVYFPRETRVYLYGPTQRPESPRGIQGQVVMQVRGNDQLYRYPLKYVRAGAGGEEYLAAPVDVSRIRDGDMIVSFHLAGLPYQQQRQASFTQTFALTRARPSVTVVTLTESDRARIARQRVCPVSGGQLGSMGTPVKLLVADQPVYLCCRGCVGKVEKNPAAYVAKAAELRAGR